MVNGQRSGRKASQGQERVSEGSQNYTELKMLKQKALQRRDITVTAGAKLGGGPSLPRLLGQTWIQTPFTEKTLVVFIE